MRLSLFVLLLFIATPLRAEEILRVAIVATAPSVRLASPSGFLIDADPGRVFSNADIGWTETGLAIDGRAVTTETIAVTPKGETIAVDGKRFGGRLIVRREVGGIRVVNEIGIEKYLAGVLPAEMPAGWPVEALKAQAVISRSYALYQKKARAAQPYDLVSSVLDQVYAGAVGDPRATAAIAQTAGEVLTYAGEVALTFFHSTSAGPTENAADHFRLGAIAATEAAAETERPDPFPYLTGASCPVDQDSPYYRWQRTIPRADIEVRLREDGYPVGGITAIRAIKWSRAGRILQMRIAHTRGDLRLAGDDFRRIVGYRLLPSTRFKIDRFGRDIDISGMGYGHGVGLCQWGAKALAERGWRYENILRHYYPGVTLQQYQEATSTPQTLTISSTPN